jgi:hypothetical protein
LVAIPKLSKYLLVTFFSVAACFSAVAQADSTRKQGPDVIFSSDDIIELKGTSIFSRLDSIFRPELRISGYVSSYFAYYDDDAESNGFNLFPTLNPRTDQFSINMALVNMAYKSHNARYNITLHYGDVPESSWPATFNLIQEANAGFRIRDKFWFDAGFFKTHIGLESFQPRENVTSSMSLPGFYAPYYLSGARLTWMQSSRLSLQFGIYNGYNEYLDNNLDKALNLSANYEINRNIAVTYNFITSDESPDNRRVSHRRYYQNVFATFLYDKLHLGLDFNYGLQENTGVKDSTGLASTYGAVAVAKYLPWKNIGFYTRAEYFSDPDMILTGNLNIGDYIGGVTAGVSYKPQKTTELSLEWRLLQSDNLIFRQANYRLNQRNEFSLCLDLWF